MAKARSADLAKGFGTPAATEAAKKKFIEAGKPAAAGGSRLRRSGDVPMEKLTVYIPEELATRLRVHCAKNRQSNSDALTEAVQAYLDKQET
jgi:hypothetical protein